MQSTTMHEVNGMLNGGISILEVRKSVMSLNKNKSPGYDNIPAEVNLTHASAFYTDCFVFALKQEPSGKPGIMEL